MKKTASLVATTAIAVGTVAAVATPANAFEVEREKSKRCSLRAFATLSLEKEFGRVDADFEIENAPAGRSWNVRIKRNGKTVLHTKRVADHEGEVDVMQQVRDRRGKDRFIARATGPNGEVCRVRLSI
ncbi:MAG: hypothetical protein R2720_07205 [Candidatus Nanopelagicales bacterium]